MKHAHVVSPFPNFRLLPYLAWRFQERFQVHRLEMSGMHWGYHGIPWDTKIRNLELQVELYEEQTSQHPEDSYQNMNPVVPHQNQWNSFLPNTKLVRIAGVARIFEPCPHRKQSWNLFKAASRMGSHATAMDAVGIRPFQGPLALPSRVPKLRFHFSQT